MWAKEDVINYLSSAGNKNKFKVLRRRFPGISDMLNPTYDFVTSLYLYIHGMDCVPKCPVCGHNLSLLNFNRGFREFCSRRCASVGTREKSKQTCMGRYGTGIPTQSKEIKEKLIHTNQIKYGGPSPMCSDEVKGKSRQTCMGRYGVEYSVQADKVREKSRQTCLGRYGVENAAQSKEIKKKLIHTNQIKYGGPSPMCSDEVKEKARQTNINRYGVPYYPQDPGCKEKVRQTNMEHFGVPNKMIDMLFRGEIKYKGYSNISQECFRRLDGILNLPSYYATRNQEFCVTVDNKNYYLDYYVPSLNLAVEFNGDWFHFNPSKYKAEDVVEQFGHPVSVGGRWEEDAARVKAIESTGIKVLILWEGEYRNMSDRQLKELIHSVILGKLLDY